MKRDRYYVGAKVKVARALFFANALIWVGFAIYIFMEMTSLGNGLPAYLVSFFMLANAGAMLGSGIMIAKRMRWAYFFGIAVLALNILLTFTDQFGVYDFITLLADIVILMILVSMSRTYFINP
ncbi:MAG: hypothetical protein HZB19_13515 [Chloroflexi bacterium]|nr:hypothetical protein [Chloroflexota bacterium]